MRVAVLASGSGSNLQALLDAAREPGFPAQIALVLSNNPEAYALRRAEQAGVPTAVINHRDFPDRPTFEAAVQEALSAASINFVCLAGFMRILTAGFVEPWQDRMLNIHPSLLPDFRGLDTHARALAAGKTEHGCTVHFVRPDLDDGPLIIQAKVPVQPNDTPEKLAKRVLAQEHVIYPAALRWVAEGRVTVRGDTALVDEQPGPVFL